MKDKNNIDNLFKKGLQNLDASPSPKVWENIQAKLKEEKQDRKLVPLWIKLGGVAAIMALLLSVGNWVFDSSSIIPHSITSEDSINVDDSKSRSIKIEQELDTKIVHIDKNSDDSLQQDAANSAEQKSIHSNAEKAIANKSTEENSNTKLKKSESGSVKALAKTGNVLTKNAESSLTKNGFDAKQSEENIIPVKENITATKPSIDIKEKEEIKTSEIIKKKSLLDVIAENKEDLASAKTKKELISNRWNVAPVIAPVYYSSFGNGSSLDPDLGKNSQSGDVNMSYGVQVGYAVNKRLSIRTGINNLDLSYSTSGVDVASAPSAKGLSSVDYGSKNVVLTVFNKGTINENVSGGGFSNINLKSTAGNARVIQSINYYEVPVELKYALINDKFGVNLIGGLSTLILGNNEISVRAEDFSAVLGEANNLSNISFSTNIGLGLDYKISKHFTFNVEPMFKYQINPYTDSSVDFKPFYLGVYSGINFRF